jgi:hypothetical protein
VFDRSFAHVNDDMKFLYFFLPSPFFFFSSPFFFFGASAGQHGGALAHQFRVHTGALAAPPPRHQRAHPTPRLLVVVHRHSISANNSSNKSDPVPKSKQQQATNPKSKNPTRQHEK